MNGLQRGYSNGLYVGRHNGRHGGLFAGGKRDLLQKQVAAPDPGGWVPTDIAGCQLWLKADAGITKDGSNYVSQWADQSGNGHNLVQASGVNQPLWVNAQLNGYPSVKFQTNDCMVVSFGENINMPITVFIVYDIYHIDAGYPYQQIFSGINEYFGLRYWLNAYIDLRVNADVVRINKTAPFNYLLHACKFANPTGAIYENGVLQTASPNTLLYYYTDGITLGAFNGNIVNADANIVEFIMYNDNINDTDRQLVENYINTKYALW